MAIFSRGRKFQEACKSEAEDLGRILHPRVGMDLLGMAKARIFIE